MARPGTQVARAVEEQRLRLDLLRLEAPRLQAVAGDVRGQAGRALGERALKQLAQTSPHTVRVEREHCCDDLAVVACGDAVLYARALTAIETMRHDEMGVAMAMTAPAPTAYLLHKMR